MKYFKINCRRLRAWRGLMWHADMKRDKTFRERYFEAWVYFFKTERDRGDVLYQEYLMKICKKMVGALQQNRIEQKEYRDRVYGNLDKAAEIAAEKKKNDGDDGDGDDDDDFGGNDERKRNDKGGGKEGGDGEDDDDGGDDGGGEEKEEGDGDGEEKEKENILTPEEIAFQEAEKERSAEEARVKDEEERKRAQEELKAQREEAMRVLQWSITLFQAKARGAMERLKWEERKVAVFTSVQTLQNYFRRILALLLCRRKIRARDLFNVITRDRETHDMWRMDQFSQYYRTCYNSCLNIQRVYRGYIGRIKAAIDAFDISRARGVDWYESGA